MDIHVSFILTLSLGILLPGQHCPEAIDIEGCDALLDLLLILDSSRSLMESDPLGQEGLTWAAVRNFSRGLVEHLPVGRETRVAAIRYGTEPEVLFHLDHHHSAETAGAALLETDHLGGNTNTAAALRLARTDVFDGVHGARSRARNVVVFVGDGIDNVGSDSLGAAIKDLKELSEANVYAVGVSREILAGELRRLASYPPEHHFLHAPRLVDLAVVQAYLVRRICHLPDPDFPLPSEPECTMPGCKTCDSTRCFVCEDGKFLSNDQCLDCLAHCRICDSVSTCIQCRPGWFWVQSLGRCEACELVADLALVIDNSGSIRDKNPDDDSYDNYQLLKDFINRLLDRLDVGENVTRVGAIKFSSKSHLVFHLDTYSHRPMIQEAISEMTFGGGHTNISGGLRMMRNDLFRAGRGDRPDVGNLAILVTDGESTVDKNSTLAEAQLAKSEGITLFVVGVTDEVNEDELRTIASPPVEDHYFNSVEIRNLDELLDSLIRQICNPQLPGDGEL